MKIILLRHGQTAWNVGRKYQGQTDIPLNDYGEKQALMLAEFLAHNETIDRIYSSDLSRAYRTASIIASRLGLDVQQDARLREVSFGRWESLTFSEVYSSYKEEFEHWYRDPFYFRIPGGETFQELALRSMAAISEITQKPSRSVAIVTHGGVIKAVLRHLDTHYDMWQDTLETASLTYLQYVREGFIPLEIGVQVMCREKKNISNWMK